MENTFPIPLHIIKMSNYGAKEGDATLIIAEVVTVTHGIHLSVG